MQTFVSSCALARLSTAMAKKTFSRVSVMKAVKSASNCGNLSGFVLPSPFQRYKQMLNNLDSSCICFLFWGLPIASHGLRQRYDMAQVSSCDPNMECQSRDSMDSIVRRVKKTVRWRCLVSDVHWLLVSDLWPLHSDPLYLTELQMLQLWTMQHSMFARFS